MTPTPVGMRCPECSRERTKVKTVRSGPTVPIVTRTLIAINVIVFLAETASGASLGGGGGGYVFDHGALYGPLISQEHQYQRLLFSGFLHDGLLHILFNMVFLYIMGPMLEPAIGRLNFALVYFVSLLAGSFGALLFQPDAVTVGASGACFGVLGALIVVAYYRGISIWQSGLGLTLAINIVFSLSIAGISIGAHIGGVIAGAICGWLIVQLGERRRMPAAALAACALVAVLSVVGALAVAGSTGLTPNGIGFSL
jgi:membrane associated rhomboid family serine protease